MAVGRSACGVPVSGARRSPGKGRSTGPPAAAPRRTPARRALGARVALLALAASALSAAGCLTVATDEAGEAGAVPLLELRREIGEGGDLRTSFVASAFAFEGGADGYVQGTPVSGRLSATFARAALEFAGRKSASRGLEAGVSVGLAATRSVRFSYPWQGGYAAESAGEWTALGLIGDMGFFVRVRLSPRSRARFECRYGGGFSGDSWAESLVAIEVSSSPNASVILGFRAVEGNWFGGYHCYVCDDVWLSADVFAGPVVGLGVTF